MNNYKEQLSNHQLVILALKSMLITELHNLPYTGNVELNMFDQYMVNIFIVVLECGSTSEYKIKKI